MPLPAEFYTSLSTRSKDDLFSMIVSPAGFESEAIEAARHELIRRGIEVPDPMNMPPPLPIVAEQAKRANEPLEWPIKLVCAIALMPGGFLYHSYRKQGFNRKAREMTEWTLLGLGIYALFFVAARLLRTN